MLKGKLFAGVNAAITDNAFRPVTIESGKSNTLAGRGVIKAAVVEDDADVSEFVEKDERAEFVAVVAFDRHGILPESFRARSLERKTRVEKNAPDESRTVERIGSR